MKTAQLAGLAACLALTACSVNENEYVRIRRDPALLEQRAEARKKTPDQLRWEREDLRASQRLNRDQKYWQQYYTRSRDHHERLIGSISEDPWRSYEQARKDTFYRRWADRHQSLPEVLPDTDGPPGWLGPRLPPSQGGTVDPNAEDSFEPAPESETDDSGDDGWGDDGGDDSGDDWGDSDDGDGGDDDWGDDDW